jgi:hypothetical protein
MAVLQGRGFAGFAAAYIHLNIVRGKYFHLMFICSVDRETTFTEMFIFKLKWKTNIIEQTMQQINLSCIEINLQLVSICHLVKIDLKPLESNLLEELFGQLTVCPYDRTSHNPTYRWEFLPHSRW